jgi:hypothetical protein
MHTQQILCWLYEALHHADWVQNLILALTAIIGLITLWVSRRQERRRATVDLALRSFDSTELIKARLDFNTLVKSKLTKQVIKDLIEGPVEKRSPINSVANRYEFIATGLKQGAFDRKIYKTAYSSQVIRDWKALAGYVTELRKQHSKETAFVEFEWMAKKFQKKSIWKEPINWLKEGKSRKSRPPAPAPATLPPPATVPPTTPPPPPPGPSQGGND